MTFEQFVAARLTALSRYATMVTCDAHLAQDVVQEVLVRAQARWSRISQLDQPEAYVKRMVLNEYLSWRRRQRSIPTTAPTLQGAAGGYEDPVAQLIERDAMVRRIAMLPRKQRIVVVLRFYEGCSDAEIAALLGCRETTVRSHCSRALATLVNGQDEVALALIG